ncbi:hypothetical protein [Burkholderia stabilis]|uniref:hypothetical protein n=1 Tax=Burkholderia stabilis TaxID=95485 RepID=UPI001E314159|nr:hypothetical protein [Burkholderia stabilis]
MDRFNRQLHPEEKTLAKQIADGSKGQYTQAQIEDQMRLMGMSVNGKYESGAPTTLVGEMPTDSGAKWISGGMTSDGKPILAQVTVQADQQLQDYILARYNSASPAQVPSQFSYQQTGSGSMNITGPFTKFDKSDVNYVRNTTADAASFGATQLDRLSALATTMSAMGLPAEQIAITSSVGSWLLTGVQQVARPNFGDYSVSTAIGQVIGGMTGKYPLAAPIINEFGGVTSNGAQAQLAKEWVNKNMQELIGRSQ